MSDELWIGPLFALGGVLSVALCVAIVETYSRIRYWIDCRAAAKREARRGRYDTLGYWHEGQK